MSELKKQIALVAAVAAAFASNKEAQELLATPDGNCFLPSNKSAAELHARRTNQSLATIPRERFEKENIEDLKNALAEQAAAEQEKEEKEAAEKEAAEKEAAEKEAAEKEAAEKEAAEKEAAEKEAAEKAAEKAAAAEKKAAAKKGTETK